MRRQIYPFGGIDRNRREAAGGLVHRTAEEFLRAFRAASAEGHGLEAIADDAEGFAAAIAHDAATLDLAMHTASNLAGGVASVPVSAFAAAACRRDGRLIASDPAFGDFDLPRRSLEEALRGADSTSPRLSAIVDDANGRPVALAMASPSRALAWPMGAAVRDALASGAAEFGLLGVRSARGADWPALFAPWTFSAAEARVASGLVQRGDLRGAAADAGVSYETAREMLATAMAKTGARRQPAFVRQLAQLAFGDLPSNEATWRTLADTFGLSERQGRLALLVALGATRATAAGTLGISDNTAKVDLKVVYDRCGVDSGAALGRVVAETDALARLAAATDVELLSPGDITAPLRFIRRRRAPGRIAVEDHGLQGATPVVIFHSPTTGRHLPRKLVMAMKARHLRPISVDRPGYGLTSPSDDDPVSGANADLVDVLDGLGLGPVRLLGRSIAMPMRFAAAHPERVERGLLLSATPPGARTTEGLLGAFMGLALDRPQLILGFARMVAKVSTERSILRITERAVANSAADLAALADPINRADWIRASRQSVSGEGFAREFALHADGAAMPAGAYDSDWDILFGAQDSLAGGHRDPVMLWKAVAPKGRVEVVADGGRLIHLSHPARIADILAGPQD
jgi:pimeloyl-ACP methyl ester carboxylesterase/DNA-binding CsgD family transcriptional regulator